MISMILITKRQPSKEAGRSFQPIVIKMSFFISNKSLVLYHNLETVLLSCYYPSGELLFVI